ncbi:DUF6192 family protein [Streptomyces sp. UG1]|uniref:DUF6192 family protein n=1 Tax=Streptomyces sp. UG1 TaxID=3417652 RepID=UPI003CE84B12
MAYPPLDEATGRRRWTPDAARRRAGHQVAKLVSTQEKVNAIHTLARDEEVAGKVTTDILRRPDVAFRAMSDDTARHQVNHAQVERSRQARERFERTNPHRAHREAHRARDRAFGPGPWPATARRERRPHRPAAARTALDR